MKSPSEFSEKLAELDGRISTLKAKIAVAEERREAVKKRVAELDVLSREKFGVSIRELEAHGSTLEDEMKQVLEELESLLTQAEEKLEDL